MTMPHVRTRAVIETKKFLEELRMRNDIPDDVRKDAIWCLRHYPNASDLKIAGYATTRSGLENPFGTSPDYDEHKANLKKIEALERDKPSKREPLFDIQAEGQSVKIEIMKDSEKKSIRQAEFIKSCEGFFTEEIVNHAKLFQCVDVSKFKVEKMSG